jgi:hypothetical protein
MLPEVLTMIGRQGLLVKVAQATSLPGGLVSRALVDNWAPAGPPGPLGHHGSLIPRRHYVCGRHVTCVWAPVA